MNDHLHWSSSTLEKMEHRQRIEDLYRRGLEVVRDAKLYGFDININNPKEVIACLYLLAEDFSSFHERF